MAEVDPDQEAGPAPAASRLRPQQLIGGRPAGMLGRRVPLLIPGLARVVEAKRGVRLARRISRHGMQISTVV